MKNSRLGRRGQAVVEIAIFGALALSIFGIILSYLQQFNDQQYVQMEAFRRGLERACTYQSDASDGVGASVSMSVIQNRHHASVTEGFKKGNTAIINGSANVFWAVPKSEEGVKPDSLLVFRVNEDQKEVKYSDYVPDSLGRYDDEGEERAIYRSFSPDEIDFKSDTVFNEATQKQEDTQSITNIRNSTLQDTVQTTINYKLKELSSSDSDYEHIIEEGTLWDVNQGAYRDASDGQYKYSQSTVGTEVQRGRAWRTDF